ncbi:MAG: hypothetical protein AAFX85_07935 [Pseudomonadota bacterium]
MRKLAALLIPIALAVSSTANAQFCIDFDLFIDGITVRIGSEGVISAVWQNYDGLGSQAPMVGFTDAGGGANVLVCSDASCPFGQQYAFYIAYPVQSFWLFDLTNGVPIVTQSPFSLSGGACTFGPEAEGTPSLMP